MPEIVAESSEQTKTEKDTRTPITLSREALRLILRQAGSKANQRIVRDRLKELETTK